MKKGVYYIIGLLVLVIFFSGGFDRIDPELSNAANFRISVLSAVMLLLIYSVISQDLFEFVGNFETKSDLRFHINSQKCTIENLEEQISLHEKLANLDKDRIDLLCELIRNLEEMNKLVIQDHKETLISLEHANRVLDECIEKNKYALSMCEAYERVISEETRQEVAVTFWKNATSNELNRAE